MDYEEFIVQFRARAAARMVEFERALAKTQEEADKARKQTTGNNTTQVVQPLVKPIQPARGRARGRGQVQSVLRKA